jgi:phosphoribosylamine--glycine ligase
MDVLVIGGGGREHALAWKLRQSPHVGRIYVAPGNSGAERLPQVENAALAANDVTALTDFAQARKVALTIVGPEAPLAAGVVDAFQSAGAPIFGPTRTAAQLESSKAFSKNFMMEHGIPTARAAAFADFQQAVKSLGEWDAPPVIKASGLAAGKGVVLPASFAEAEDVLHDMLVKRIFGQASATVLLEERLSGPEVSVLAFCDGKTARVMPAAQDHKRLLDGDRGPNTGGMGAFAPSPLFTPDLLAAVQEEILLPTLAGMAAMGAPYVGVLYAGLMLTEDGPKVLEFNCRLGDPETQVILPLLESDLVDICQACMEGKLDQFTPAWREQAAVTVVMAAGGYPGDYASGRAITGVEQAEEQGCLVFHAGAKRSGDALLSAGGRVLAVTGVADSIDAAADLAYRGAAVIRFDGAHYRTDIARRPARYPRS